ncbi:hypothetical protein [Streptomyces sp. NPDC093598]|uniref:hypothetical protein n=1 Tax=Streptomyces sp. NPDC093598 TaxID=3366046 RepID=UPI00380377EA
MLLVVGDFDCSGEDIERDWVTRTGCWSRTERVLLTYAQVRDYELPATEGKHGDPRWPAFACHPGFDPARPVQWEVEALESAELQRLVLAAVDPYVDRDVLARQVAREDAQRRPLAAFLDGWDATAGGAPRSAFGPGSRSAVNGKPRARHRRTALIGMVSVTARDCPAGPGPLRIRSIGLTAGGGRRWEGPGRRVVASRVGVVRWAAPNSRSRSSWRSFSSGSALAMRRC